MREEGRRSEEKKEEQIGCSRTGAGRGIKDKRNEDGWRSHIH